MTDVLERRLAATTLGGVRVIDAVTDGAAVHVTFARGHDPRPLGLEAARLAGATLTSAGGSALLTGARDGAESLATGAGPIPLDAAEPALFDGLDAVLAFRNGEPLAAVRDWLRHHAAQGMAAALIVDRRRAGDAPLGAGLIGFEAPGLVRVVVVDPGAPLGADAPSERHPFMAPDAPGKDRMEVPPHDPWTAPLGEMGVFEAMRARFLGRAASVASFDVSDVLAPGADPWGAAKGSAAGAVQLIGRRVYPWRVREGRAPAFGDHICDQFDNPGGNRRWACDPARVPQDDLWRLVRVGGVAMDAERTQFFFRAMAIRTPDADGLPLVPKTSLVPDEGLIAMARDAWGHKPVLPPAAPEARPGAIPAALPGRTAIVTCMKNEGPFILEWLAHHRAIGVDDFLVYTNDCTDGTDQLLDLLQSHGIAQRRDNPFREPAYEGMKPQHAALAAAESEPILARAGWAVSMDVDEFICVHAGAGHLRDLYAAVGDANMISMTWRLFGNSDLSTYEEAPTPARLTRCAPRMIRKPHQAWGFKTLFRNLDIYKKLGVHRPKGLRPELWEEIAWVNGSGAPMPKEMLRNGWRSTIETVGYDLVTLNHYAVRDAESFLVKRDRGRVNHVERDQGLGYWFRMNNNAEEDRSMLRRVPALEAEMDRLLALPGVRAAHDACVAAHRAKIAALKATDAFGAFYREITGERMRRLSRMHAHFGANVFLAGPDAVPDDVALGEHAPDFFFTVGEVARTQH